MDLRERAILGEEIGTHWYYRSKADALVHLLSDRPPRRILDVGAGSGFFSRELLARTGASDALCVDTAYDRDHDEMASGKPLRFRRECPAAVDADCLLMMDVLEHVADDGRLLEDYAQRLLPGAVVLITVPAFGLVWSGHDDFLGHKRRYRLEEVEALARRAGLEVRSSAYLFALVFPLAVARRLFHRLVRGDRPQSELVRHSPPVNALLRAVCALELPWFRLNRLAGLTACCVASKPSSGA